MIGKSLWLILLSCSLLLMASACAAGPPPLRQCDRITLRTSQGWWLAINRDGSGEYGFGVLIDRVAVAPGTFDFAGLYRESLGAWRESQPEADGPAVAVACFAPGGSSAQEYSLALAREWSETLFCQARRNSLPPRNPMEQRWHETIDRFWAKDSPCPAPEPAGVTGGHLP